MPSHTARRRLTGALAAAGAAIALAPAGADAKLIELGETETRPKPTCPGTEQSDCLAVTRTTGYQAKIGTQKDPFLVPRDGRIVAWTLITGDPNRKEIAFFNSGFGGAPSAGITVLEKAEKGSTLQRVTAQSPVRNISDYLGRKVQFPLQTTLRVEKGQRVALTVPTWAPVLAPGFGGGTSWRSSRTKGECEDFATQTAMTRLGGQRRFQCFYNGARLTYSVTLITEPKVKKKRRKGDGG